MDEPILVYLQRKLRDAGRRRWLAIEAETGVKEPLIRKLAYAGRPNPGVTKVQPLLDFFWAVDRGERVLPSPKEREGGVSGTGCVHGEPKVTPKARRLSPSDGGYPLTGRGRLAKRGNPQ